MCKRQDDLREKLLAKMQCSPKTQQQIENEIGISKFTMWQIKNGKNVGRLTLLKIEVWLLKNE